MTLTGTGGQADPIGRQQLRTHPMFHRVFAARPMAVRAVLAEVRGRFRDQVGDETLGRLELVLAEVMNNVTEHGPKRAEEGTPSIHLCIVSHEGGLACAVTDDGVSLPPECLMPRNLPNGGEDGLPEGGFGWYLIQDLTHALCYYREDRRNFLAFSIPYATEMPAVAV